MVQCLTTLGTKPREVSSAITRFPHILSHNVEEKLCPLLGFFEALGVPEKQLGKLLLQNPRLVSYSIDTKLTHIVEFLASLGLSKEEGTIGKVMKSGFGDRQIASLVSGYPPVLIKSVPNSLEPRIRFLLEVMKRQIEEVVEYPDFFKHGLKKKLEVRQKLLKQRESLAVA
ncbi:hypothetical protein C5167_038776 [Papaver somniferum]|uniref:Uncharacterized protein n=1 Tax=Papaver somniferum TaxID=3469 RepID=A0A4Y7IDG5_PAPSO|nr:hypothetical protein C5167_038776 [Papaver somniferum]